MNTIEIVRSNGFKPMYRAIQGTWQAAGTTAGQALDTLEKMLVSPGAVKHEKSLIIVQRFQPDPFFTSQQQARLEKLMSRFHAAGNTTDYFSTEEKEEFEQLIEAELEATIARTDAILAKVSTSTPQPIC
ncbi:MAG: hypothetical protein ACPGWR_23260 [Ardenticatenaceae bacterium]